MGVRTNNGGTYVRIPGNSYNDLSYIFGNTQVSGEGLSGSGVSFTWSFWAKYYENPTGHGSATMMTMATDDLWGSMGSASGVANFFAMYPGGETEVPIVNSSYLFDDYPTDWFHVVFVFRGSEPQEMYVNGQLATNDSDNIHENLYVSGMNAFYLLTNTGDATTADMGIAEVGIWSLALSADDVVALWNSTPNDLPIGLEAYYPLQYNYNDYSGYGNNLTYSGVTLSSSDHPNLNQALPETTQSAIPTWSVQGTKCFVTIPDYHFCVYELYMPMAVPMCGSNMPDPPYGYDYVLSMSCFDNYSYTVNYPIQRLISCYEGWAVTWVPVTSVNRNTICFSADKKFYVRVKDGSKSYSEWVYVDPYNPMSLQDLYSGWTVAEVVADVTDRAISKNQAAVDYANSIRAEAAARDAARNG